MPATIQTIEKPTKARALDTSGNNNHGQIYSGRALEFDGVSDNLSFNSGTDIVGVSEFADNTPWTMSIWFNQDSSKWCMWAGNDFSTTRIFGIHNDGYLFFRSSGADYYRWSDVKLEYGTWHRIVIVASGVDSTMTAYINGSQYGTAVNKDTIAYSNSDGSSDALLAEGGSYASFSGIGAPYGTGSSRYHHFNGKLCDYQVWDTAWTADDVLYDYNNPEQLALNRGGTSLTNSNLKLWYPMNDGHRGQQSYILDASNTGLSDNLVINGGFDADTGSALTTGDDWVLGTGWSIANGKASCDGSQTGNSSIYQEQNAEFVSPDLQATWKIVFTISDYSAGTLMAAMGGYDYPGDPNVTFAANGTHEVYHKPTHTSSNNRVYLTANTDFVGSIDNVEVYRVNDKNHATTVFYGDELATNGSFSTDSNWNKNSNWSIGSGVATADGTSSNNINQNAGLTIGRTYQVSFDITSYTSGGGFAVRVGSGGSYSTPVTSVATHTVTQTCKGNGYIYINADSSAVGSIDNVSIKEVGTASGWTNADQQLDIPQTALQSYNQLAWHDGSDDADDKEVKTSGYGGNFGTDDFVLSYCIFKNDSKETSFFFLNSGGGTAGRYGHRIQANGDLQNYATDDASTSTGYFDVASEAIQTGKWHHIVESIDRSDNEVTVWVDGESYGSTSISATGTISTSSNISAGGAISFLNFSTSNFINGTINEISIWKNTEFTQSDVNELYNDGKILDARKHSKEVNSSKLANYWTNDGLTLWQDKKGSAHVTTNDLTETMVVTAGADNSRDSQGFLMN